MGYARLASSILLCLTLHAAVSVRATAEGSEEFVGILPKAGVCPAVPDGTVGDCTEWCSNDEECDGTKKCCSNGCGHVCVDAASNPAYEVIGPQPKAGQCPAVAEGVVGTCVQQCSNDEECDGNKKCCSNGCGHVCREPVEGQGGSSEEVVGLLPKAGVCPAVVQGQSGICVEECSNDEECDGNKKCCSNGCGHICREPDVEVIGPQPKAGQCPTVAEGVVGTCVQQCSNDEECDGNKKCCSNGCGNECQDPEGVDSEEPPKPGVCPVVRETIGACIRECSSDSECNGTSKCCPNGCGYICSDPEIGTKRGVCPAVHSSDGVVGMCVEACQNDTDCDGELKCCSNGCGQACLIPVTRQKPGWCPAVEAGTEDAICEENCKVDEDCVGNKKCCSNGCGRVCTAPGRAREAGETGGGKGGGEEIVEIPTKQGVCPAVQFSDGLEACVEACQNDGDCDGELKCCSNGCGHQCTIPITVRKPGWCPAVEAGTEDAICEENCKVDEDCDGNKKCCSNGCGRVCTAPGRARGESGGSKGKGSQRGQAEAMIGVAPSTSALSLSPTLVGVVIFVIIGVLIVISMTVYVIKRYVATNRQRLHGDEYSLQQRDDQIEGGIEQTSYDCVAVGNN